MKGKSLKQLVREAGPDEYVLVTYETGAAVYIGELDSTLQITTTTDFTMAKKWGALDAVNTLKLNFHKAITGFVELKFEKVIIS